MAVRTGEATIEQPGTTTATFAYHRSLGPVVGIILGLACVETFVVHIVAVALWGWTVAIVLGLLDVSLIASLLWLLRAFRRCPIILQGDLLTMRTGSRLHVAVPIETIVRFRASWSAEDLKAPHVLNMALLPGPTS